MPDPTLRRPSTSTGPSRPVAMTLGDHQNTHYVFDSTTGVPLSVRTATSYITFQYDNDGTTISGVIECPLDDGSEAVRPRSETLIRSDSELAKDSDFGQDTQGPERHVTFRIPSNSEQVDNPPAFGRPHVGTYASETKLQRELGEANERAKIRSAIGRQ